MNLLFKFKNKMFFIYAIYTLLLSVTISCIFFSYTSQVIIHNAEEVPIQTCEKISYKLEAILSSMDNTCLQVISSKQLQTILRESNQSMEETNFFDYNYKSTVSNILTSINGPLINNARLSIFDKNKNFITVGSLGVDNQAFLNNFVNYEVTLSSLGRGGNQFAILPPKIDNWVSSEPLKTVISFLRIIPNISNSYGVLGYVEVEQPFEIFTTACSVATDQSLDVLIVNQENQLIYSSKNTDLSQEEMTLIREKAVNLNLTYSDENHTYYYQQDISRYGWTIILSQPDTLFEAPNLLLKKLLILFNVVFYIISLFIIYAITTRLTVPINQLRRSIETISNTNPHVQLSGKIYNNEIIMLTEAFNNTLSKLNASMEQTLVANKNQVQAHILAMQSQMNPHFLFNTLMAISGIAEEDNSTKIVEISDKLASMLRYISSFKDSIVTISDEIMYTKNYLELMKIRYEDFLQYSFAIAGDISDFQVPKLILQPIVENCFSHGFQNMKPPYVISLKISVMDQYLELLVSDNGEGFTDTFLSEFSEKITTYRRELDANSYLALSEIGGLGLLNIYLRLLLRYGKAVEIVLHNNTAASGCCVRLLIPRDPS